ncbi:MAG TPA: hypothetical protein VGJ59_21705 [Jatrophihabitantaceae bacterium]|jgi:hypothetical protein
MNRQEFLEAVDWAAVRDGMRETRAELDMAIAQRVAELRAAGQPERLTDKETLAAWQGAADLLDAFLAALGDA